MIKLPEKSYQARNLSDEEESYKPLPSKQSVKAIACGGRHNLILTKDGALYSFGFGQ
jgi:alpha-tubulin suppressor-like RCC1 family protein